MKSFSKLILALSLLPLPLFAHNKVGNGGNVITCPKATQRLLDFYETDLTLKPAAG